MWDYRDVLGRISSSYYFLFVAGSILFTNSSSFAQADGAELFNELCVDCHSIGDGVYFGPDLLGIEKRRSGEWLIRFTQSSKTLIKEGDKDAIAVFEEYEKEQMPDTEASLDEIKAIFDYIKSFSKGTASGGASTETNSDKKSGQENKTDGSVIEPDDFQGTSEKESGQSLTSSYDERLKMLDEKVELLLKYHRRTASIEITNEDIKKGKGLFLGNIPFQNGAVACVSCHNVKVADTINWNPSALDIAKLYLEKSDAEMEKVLLSPVSKKMKAMLEGHELTEREIYTIRAYLNTLVTTGNLKSRKLPVRKIIFVVLVLLILLSLTDLLFTKKIKPRFITILVLLIAMVINTRTIVKAALNIGLTPNYEPTQPIKFSHKIHSSENGIACLYCHSTAEYSKIAGIPSENICMNCHYKIKSGTKSEKFEIDKIYRALETKQPIRWIKIHNLPDHVYYSHAQHVGAGKLECQTCHGKVEEMHTVRQIASLSMSWCIKCHREMEVQFTENKYYEKFEQLQKEIKSGKIDKVTVDELGGNDCQKCHY